MNYTQEQIANVKAELKSINSGKMANQFAKDAHQAICNAYTFNWQTKEHSINESANEFKMTKANDILNFALANGVDGLVFGEGRAIIQRKA